MGTYYTQGIIIGHQDYRDTDRLVTIFSGESGVVKAVAKASRKISSKLGGNLEPYIAAMFMIVRGRRYETVAHVEVTKNYRRIKQDLEKIGLAQYIAHIVEQAAIGHQHDTRIYGLIVEVFDALESMAAVGKKGMIVQWYFVWRCLAYVGFTPELYACLVCRKKITAAVNYFSFKKGGCVHAACRAAIADAIPVSPNAIKILRHVLKQSLAEALRLAVPPAVQREVEHLTGTFLNYTQERDFQPRNFHHR
jgi:DNA repair protein RecO (recombination protein O)